MSYEVTATRRRPQKLEDLIGQEFVADTLRNSIQSSKIAHAYLFSGPRGCGKTSTARILAKALNCEKGPTATPCGVCSACTEITKGSSLDVIEIDGASNTSVNDVRQIKDEVLFPPNSCRYKIYIIDEVHMLSTSAFNALLKTIEEPPPYVIFIFATTELQKVPATIKSRCQQFNFRLVPIEKVKEQLSLAASEIGIKAEDEALYWIARESTGSMRDAYTLFDQVAAFSDGEISYEKIRDKLGLVGVDRLNELFTLCVKQDVTTALTKIDEYLQNGISIEQLISNCSDYLRSILLIKSGITKEALLGQAYERYAQEVISSWNNIQIERGLDIFLQLYRDIRYSLSPRYELELAVSRLCWLKDYVSSADVKKAVEAVKPLFLQSTKAQVNINTTSEKSVVKTVKQTDDEPEHIEQTSVEQKASTYVPHFSALESSSQNLDGQEEQHPFYNGGAVPPVNNTAAGDYLMEEENFAPDDSDDESESSSVEEQSAKENFYATLDVTSEQDSDSSIDIQERENVDIQNLSGLDKVKAIIVNDLSSDNDELLASVITRTKNWSQKDNSITVYVDSAYEKIQLQNSITKVTESLSKIMNASISLIIEIEEKNISNEKSELPVEVQILRDTFRGTVLGCD